MNPDRSSEVCWRLWPLLSPGEGGSRANDRRGKQDHISRAGGSATGWSGRPVQIPHKDLKQVCLLGRRGAFFSPGPESSHLHLVPWWGVGKGFPPILGQATGLRATRGGPSQGDIRR